VLGGAIDFSRQGQLALRDILAQDQARKIKPKS
jgi:hypothetical protein